MAALVKDPNNIKLGIIGMTEGNGHPYSWSAIFNRYDVDAMTKECPFPGIPEYLNKEDYNAMGIPGARVAMVFCDKRSDAEHVARLSLIPGVAAKPEDMIGRVDAVIIATDIGSEHRRRANRTSQRKMGEQLESAGSFGGSLPHGRDRRPFCPG